MTEKRFKLSEPNGAYLIDGDKPLFHMEGSDDEIVDLLNELSDENEQMKYDNAKQVLTIGRQMEEIECLSEENEQLKQENQEYKSILQDMGMLMSDEDVVNIRNDIADKLLKPLFKSNGFDVDIDTTNGFAISLKEEKE